MRNNKLLQAGAALAGFILIILAITVFLRQPAKLEVSHLVLVQETVANAARYDQSSILVTSPEAGMLAYNLRQGTQQQIAAAAQISSPDSIAVSEDQQYVLFHTNFVKPATPLGVILQDKQQSLGSDYWWLYSVVSKSYIPFPEGTIQVKFYNNSAVGLAATATGETITVYSLGGEAGDVAAVSKTSDFYPVSGGYLLQTTNGKLLFTQGGVVSRKVADSTAIVGGRGEQLVVTQKTGSSQSIAIVNLTDYSVKTVASNVSGKQAWLKNGVILYSTLGDNSSLRTYNLDTNKTTTWAVSVSGQNYTNLAPVAFYNETTALVVNNTNDYYLISSNPLSSVAGKLFY